MSRERNWANNHTFTAGRIHRPTSSDEVRRLPLSAEIEAILLPLGGRPHWGKIIHSPAAAGAALSAHAGIPGAGTNV